MLRIGNLFIARRAIRFIQPIHVQFDRVIAWQIQLDVHDFWNPFATRSVTVRGPRECEELMRQIQSTPKPNEDWIPKIEYLLEKHEKELGYFYCKEVQKTYKTDCNTEELYNTILETVWKKNQERCVLDLLEMHKLKLSSDFYDLIQRSVKDATTETQFNGLRELILKKLVKDIVQDTDKIVIQD